MKLNRLLAFICLVLPLLTFGQAKKPTIMVVPADTWCIENGYYTDFNNQGRQQKLPDYERAVTENSDLLSVVTKIGELMADQGMPLKDLSAAIKSVNRNMEEDELTQSSTSGAGLASTPLQRLANRAKADIIVEVAWKVNSTGPKNSVTYTLRGLDAYTDKQVAAAQGTGAPSFSAEVPLLIEEAVIGKMDNFTAQLQNHFDDLFENGREVSVTIQVFDNGSGLSLEDEYDGEELTDIIDDWMAKNTVNHRYSLSDADESRMIFEQVRIPLYRDNGSPMDTRHFVTNLRKFLSKEPYNITSKVVTKGLGKANLILGEK